MVSRFRGVHVSHSGAPRGIPKGFNITTLSTLSNSLILCQSWRAGRFHNKTLLYLDNGSASRWPSSLTCSQVIVKAGNSMCVLIAAGKFGSTEGLISKFTRSELHSVSLGPPDRTMPTNATSVVPILTCFSCSICTHAIKSKTQIKRLGVHVWPHEMSWAPDAHVWPTIRTTMSTNAISVVPVLTCFSCSICTHAVAVVGEVPAVRVVALVCVLALVPVVRVLAVLL